MRPFKAERLGTGETIQNGKSEQKAHGDSFSEVSFLPEMFHLTEQESRVPFTIQPEFPEIFCKSGKKCLPI